MPELSLSHLGRRERQIMEIVYRRGEASVSQVLEALADPPAYSSVRTMLRLLEEKGYLRHRELGRKFIYSPIVAPRNARRSALKNLLSTFFNGSVEHAVASLLEIERGKLTPAELDRLSKLVESARSKGR